MKVEWEESDIDAGRKYSKPGIQEQWMIGYRAEMRSAEPRYVSVSLSDGMVTEPASKADMAKQLTDAGYLPVELL